MNHYLYTSTGWQSYLILTIVIAAILARPTKSVSIYSGCCACIRPQNISWPVKELHDLVRIYQRAFGICLIHLSITVGICLQTYMHFLRQCKNVSSVNFYPINHNQSPQPNRVFMKPNDRGCLDYLSRSSWAWADTWSVCMLCCNLLLHWLIQPIKIVTATNRHEGELTHSETSRQVS